MMLYTRSQSLVEETSSTIESETIKELHVTDPVSAYEGLPPLPKTTEGELNGHWKLTQEIFDKAMNHPRAQVLSESDPRLVLFKNFMTREETEHLVDLAKNKLERSKVVSSNASNQVNNARTSFGAWPAHDGFMQMIETRIHKLVGIPQEFGEGIYVLNYKQGQQYSAYVEV